MKTKILSRLLFFILGILLIFGGRLLQVRHIANSPFRSQKSSFKLKPPVNTLTGKLVEVKGEVKKESRDMDEFKEVEREQEVVSGEKLATGTRSEAEVMFEDFVKVSLAADAEVSFVSLIPSSFLIRQSTGTVTYEILKEKAPISVRSLSILFRQSNGLTRITTDRQEGKIAIEQLKGRGKMAMVDKENKTHVWEIEEGDKAVIDDREKTVESISKPTLSF